MYWRKIVFSVFLAVSFMQSLVAKDSINLEILQAFNLTDSGDFGGAISIYEKLYKDTKKGEFLKEAIKLSLNFDSKKFNELMKMGEATLKNDGEFIRLKVMGLVRQNRMKEAKQLMTDLVKTEKIAKNFSILGTIAGIQNDSTTALINFKKAYELDGDESSLMRIIGLADMNDSLKLLNDYKDKNGCTIPVCGSLLEIYLKNNDVKNVANMDTQMFELTENRDYLNNALGALVYLKDKKGVDELLNKYPFDDRDIIEAYSSVGDYESAIKNAKRAYENSEDVEYLAMLAIFEYEQNLPNVSEASLKNVIENFEKSAVKVGKPTYLNYYGYLLIDHDIDVNKGLELVKKALVLEPNSSYYLDSLAWGYYKLGECEKAKEAMDKALEDDDFRLMPEAKSHSEAIEKCKVNGSKK